MLEDFQNYLFSVCGCFPQNHFLLAVSGGIDSVVMTDLFRKSNLSFSIAHCNFQLRNDESEEDQLFLTQLAHDIHVKLHTVRFDTKEYAQNKGISIQMAARDLRYAWFEKIAKESGYQRIAVAHNQNDIIETMLLNFSRGTGIRGLMGIRPVNGRIIRPLLFASRERIAVYASDHSLHWREDSSNQETKYHRNKIRHTIIPSFQSINPAFISNALLTIKRVEDTGKILDYYLENIREKVLTFEKDRVLLNFQKLQEFPSPEITLFELLRDYGIKELDMHTLIGSFESFPGKQFHTHSHTFTRDRDYLIITEKRSFIPTEIKIENNIKAIDFPLQLSFSVMDRNADYSIPDNSNIAVLDFSKIKYPLVLRNWHAGDRFQPLGMKGSKKISDFLINIKMPRIDKSNAWIIESGGKIAWIVNQRISEAFKVDTNTSKMLVIEYNE